MANGFHLVVLLFTIFQVTLSDTGYFWHITDFHYDFTYHDEQLSCNTENVPDNVGLFGDFWCDSPWLLVNSSVRAMADIRSDVDFVLWTGDTVLHGKDKDLSYSINAGILDNVTDAIKTALPNVPVYATFGNHDYFPSDQFPPNNNQLYNDTLNRWRPWLDDPTQHDNFRKGAYYTKKTQYGLRIVALNTNLYYTSNKAILNHTDPAGQIAWLNSTLRKAKLNNEKVLVTAHIPPGIHTPNGFIWMHLEYHEPFVKVLRDYTDIIVAMHFGHDHADGFKILKNSKGKAAAPIFVAPSVTPWRYKIPTEIGPAHNPGIRLVKYDRTSGVHLEIEQYYLDLVKANQNGVASWELEYKTSSHYGLSSLTAADLTKVAGKMKTATSKEFKNYWKFYTVTPPEGLQKTCDEECHSSIICGFTEFDMTKFKLCKANMVSSACTPSNFAVVLLIKLVFIYALLQ